MEPRVLAILPNWLGDLVMVEPAVRVLRERANVIGVVQAGLADLVEDGNLCDVVEVFDRRGTDRGWPGVWRAGRRLRRFGAVGAIVFGPSLRAAALAACTGARLRRGFGGEGRELFLHEPMRPPGRQVHLVDAWLDLVGVRRGDRPRWMEGPRGREGLQELRSEGALPAGDYVVVAASAAFGDAKQWPENHFVDFARGVRQRLAATPVFVGGPTEGERLRAETLAAASDGVSLCGRTNLPTLVSVLAGARAFVGNDSGPMHLASALGIPTIGIFGSTSPVWTAPRGPRSATVGPAPVDCSPCFQRRCPFDRECLRGIGAPEVLGRLETLLAEEAVG